MLAVLNVHACDMQLYGVALILPIVILLSLIDSMKRHIGKLLNVGPRVDFTYLKKARLAGHLAVLRYAMFLPTLRMSAFALPLSSIT